VSVPDRALAAADAEYTKLKFLSGRSFDREFASFMVNDHQNDIHQFEAEAQSDHGPVGDFAKKQLSTLRKHLHIAQSLGR